MTERAYRNASVLVLDPVPANLVVCRQALNGLGFGCIDTTTNFEPFGEHLRCGRHDLVIAEAHGRVGELARLIRGMRASELGKNPFLGVILTSWAREACDVRALLASGADDVLLRPFSTSVLAGRIEALVTARKRFVVTSDYIGPDRRRPGRAGAGDGLFSAPNTLKAAVEDDKDGLARARRDISLARAHLERERIRRLAMRLATTARLRLEQGGDADAMSFAEIDRVAAELVGRLKAHASGQAIDMGAALVDVTSAILEEGEASEKQLKLIRDLAMGALESFSGGEAAQRSRAEIDRVVGKIRDRLQREAAA